MGSLCYWVGPSTWKTNYFPKQTILGGVCMNQLNEQLRAVRTSKEHIKYKMERTFDIKTLFDLDKQLNQLDEEEQKLLDQLGVL